MTTTTNNNGRLGNQIIRNLAVSIIAEKYNLYVDYSSYELINNLGIKLFKGIHNFNNTIILNDDNFFDIYNCENLKSNLNPNNNYFQTKGITNFLYNYLHTESIKQNIINNNPFRNRYNRNNDLFVHIRLTDATKWNPGINYYKTFIKNINYNKLFIATDEINNIIIKKLLLFFPHAKIIISDEIKTIQFASTCKNILLSHGSFSAVIGYLSFFSTVNYPKYIHNGNIDHSNNIWYGDMFRISGWVEHDFTPFLI